MFSKRIRIIAADGAVTDKPVFKLSAARATDAVAAGRLIYIDESTAQLRHKPKKGEIFDERVLCGGSTMREAWKVMVSGGFSVWQMPKERGMGVNALP